MPIVFISLTGNHFLSADGLHSSSPDLVMSVDVKKEESVGANSSNGKNVFLHSLEVCVSISRMVSA